MNDASKPDIVKAALVAAERLVGEARAEKATGFVQVEIHLSQGTPTGYHTTEKKAGK